MEESTQQLALRRLERIASHIDALAHNGNEGLGLTNCEADQNAQSPLEAERSKASFDVKQLTYVLDGSKAFTHMKEMMATMIENDEVLNDAEKRYDLTLPEIRAITMAKISRVATLWSASAAQSASENNSSNSNNSHTSNDTTQTGTKHNVNPNTSTKQTLADAFWHWMSLFDPSWATRIGVHYGLFLPAIQGQGTPEQVSKYLDDIQNMRIIGCFAMTELGHGSYIRGFETTATYHKETQEFIINSPTDTSTKWWIGGAAHTATHTVAFARLIIGETDYGIHSFIVQLRNPETGEVLAGRTIGDCGNKMGRNGIDNGWIQFHNVHIPRENMLMKWAKVSPEGQYTKPPKAQLSYGALIGGRVGMIQDSSDFAKKALTIAIRYSAVRKQFAKEGGGKNEKLVRPVGQREPEETILNYQSHQYRLLPRLATCYALHFTSSQIKSKFAQMQAELAQGELANLVSVHATSAGLKAYSTWWCNETLEHVRQTLGGHGYSQYSGLPALLADFAVMCTWEGDNTVLTQQTAKYLIKQLRKARAGQRLTGIESYIHDAISHAGKNTTIAVHKPEQLLSSELQLQIFKRLSGRLIVHTGDRHYQEQQKTKNKNLAWNECMVDLLLCSRVHCEYYILQCFVDAIAGVQDQQVKLALKKLADLHALSSFERLGAHLLEFGVLAPRTLAIVRELIRSLCKLVRADAVPLVDAFNFPDFVINSPLGCHSGDVYKAYLDRVKKIPDAFAKAPYWDEIIKPLVTAQKEV